jgi:hypothetical protein
MVPADAVTVFLQAGGDPTVLAAALFDRGWQTATSAAVWTDVEGDGDLDFAAGLVGPTDAQGTTPGGSVYLWRCHAGAYLRTEIAPARPNFDPPAIRQAWDLTADGVPELIVAYPMCGAHTCFTQYAVFQWDGSSMVDRFQGASDDMPYPELAVHADGSGSPAALEITATGLGSIGAGPFRSWTRTWTWDEHAAAFIPGEPVIESARYRIHALHDADDAYRRHELAAALALYRQVVDDDGLLDWPAAGDRRAELTAYAAFRRVLTFLAVDDAPQARDEFDLRLAAPSGAAEAYAELARLALAAYADSGFEGACASASAYALENPDAVLTPLDFGYANRAYTAEDICSFPGL